MLFAIIIAVIAVYSLYWWFNSRPKNYPPGFPILPIVGSVPFLPREHLHLRTGKLHEKYGPVVGGMIRNSPIIFVYGTEAVKEVLRRDEFQERPDIDFVRERSFNKRLGVFFSAGEYWQEQRRFILRHLRDVGFGKSSMESIALDEAQEIIDYLKRHNVVSISGLFNLPVVKVLWLIMGGTRFTRDDKNTQQIMDKIFRWFRISNVVGNIANVFPIVKILAPGISGHKERYQITLDLQMMFRDVIREHVKTRDTQNPRDFIDVYLNEIEKQNSNEDTGYTEESLIVILMDLFAAGAESISNTISFFLMYMVLYPNVQKAVHEELDRVIGRNRKPSLNDRSSVLVLLVTTLSVVKTQMNCADLEKCQHKYVRTANCTNANLAQIPDITKCKIEADSLDLSQNLITELTTNIFKLTGWVNLKKLFMKQCGLRTIHESSFSDLKNLDTIDLSHNEIVQLYPATFRDNGRLQTIILQSNAFEILLDGLFQNMAVREIDVSNCSISNIGSKTFFNLKRLKTLKLNKNKLNFLDLNINVLNATDYLISVDIRDNPWRCDKKLKQSLEWIINKFPQDLICDSPPRLKNKILKDLKNEDFIVIGQKVQDETVDCYTADSLVQAVYETDYENNTCSDNSKILIEPSVVDSNTIYFPYKDINYTCTFTNTSHASVNKLCIKLLAERQSIKQPENNHHVAGTSTDKWFLVGGLSAAAVFLCIFVLLLSFFVYRRHKRFKNESRTMSLAAELEREALVTTVNPVQKPPRNVRPSVTSTDTELTDIKRNARDDGSVFNNSADDISYTESVMSPGSHVDAGARTPESSVFYTPERKVSCAGSVASTIPDILKQSGHQVPYSPVHKAIYQRRNETFPLRPHSPAASLRNYGNFTTLPRRVRNDSWSSAPPGTPTTNRSHFQIYPMSDNLGVRTNALGSALSLNKSESTDMLHRKLPPGIHTQLSQPATIKEEKEKPTIPQKPANLYNINRTFPGTNRMPQRRSWTGFGTNFRNEPLTVSNSNGPRIGVRSSLPPLNSVRKDSKSKIPPTPPPKPKNSDVLRNSAFIEDEDGSEV